MATTGKRPASRGTPDTPAWPLADIPPDPRPEARDPKDTPGTDGPPESGVLREMAQTLAALEGLRERVHREDQYIRRAAATLEDDHRQAAEGLRDHLEAAGVGTDPDASEPVAEDMYGQHLLDRARAADLHGALERREQRHVRRLTHRRRRQPGGR